MANETKPNLVEDFSFTFHDVRRILLLYCDQYKHRNVCTPRGGLMHSGGGCFTVYVLTVHV